MVALKKEKAFQATNTDPIISFRMKVIKDFFRESIFSRRVEYEHLLMNNMVARWTVLFRRPPSRSNEELEKHVGSRLARAQRLKELNKQRERRLRKRPPTPPPDYVNQELVDEERLNRFADRKKIHEILKVMMHGTMGSEVNEFSLDNDDGQDAEEKKRMDRVALDYMQSKLESLLDLGVPVPDPEYLPTFDIFVTYMMRAAQMQERGLPPKVVKHLIFI